MAKKILIYVECWSTGGIETFLKNLLRRLSLLDACVHLYATWGSFENDAAEFDGLGVTYSSLFGDTDPGLPRRTYEGPLAFKEYLQSNNFDVVHVNTMNGMGLRYCAIARTAGVEQVIAHSHNSNVGEDGRFLKSILHLAGRVLFGPSPTTRLACGEQAGSFLFGNRSYEIVQNGIDIEKFTFHPEKRELARRTLGIRRDAVVVGNIGRMVKEKNPIFALHVFREVLNSVPSARFVLIGSGPLDEELIKKISDLGLGESVIRIPSISDVSAYYSAFDAFILPSAFEGIPFTTIEAQCSGLPILASSGVPREASLTELFQQLPLEGGEAIWASELCRLIEANRHADRGAFASVVASRGYDSRRIVDRFEHLYGLK